MMPITSVMSSVLPMSFDFGTSFGWLLLAVLLASALGVFGAALTSRRRRSGAKAMFIRPAPPLARAHRPMAA